MSKDEADCEVPVPVPATATPPSTPPPQQGGARRVSWANTAAVATLSPAPAEPPRRISTFRIALPQILASSVKNLLLLDLGMVVAYPTIMIPALQNQAAAGELNLNDEQTSWIGSIAYICQPVGAVLAGALLETLGRKRSMLLVNAPLLAGWLVFYWAARPEALYVACAVLGLSVGFMESSVVTYVGEISQPELRGMLTSYAELCVSVGFFVEYLLGTVTDWRNAALISALLPIVSAILITQVPETPIWLVTRGRTQDAERALRWLRGWVQAADVQDELNELCAYHKQAVAAEAAAAQSGSPGRYHKPAPPQPPPLRRAPDVIPARALSLRRLSAEMMTPDEEAAAALAALHERHRGSQNFPVGLPSFTATRKQVDLPDDDDDDEIAAWCESAACRKVVALLGRSTLRPLLVVCVLFFFQNWAAAVAVRPYAVEVFDKFGMPIDSHWATVATGATGIVGNVLCMVAVRWSGKRPLTLASLALGTACCLLLAGYAQAHTALAPGESLPVGSWAPLLLFVLLNLAWSLGIVPIPWMLLSEVFPYRTRGLAAGVAAALSYVWAFSSTKTYLDMEETLTLYGAFYLYTAISAVGFVFVYFLMAETEGRSLQDIERHYAGAAEEGAAEASQPPPALKKPRRASDTSETDSTTANGCGTFQTRTDDIAEDDSPAVGSRADDTTNLPADAASNKTTISISDEKSTGKRRESSQSVAPIRADSVSGDPGGENCPKPNVDGDTIFAPNPEEETNGIVRHPVDQTSTNEGSHPPSDNNTSEEKQSSPTDETASRDRNDCKEGNISNVNTDSKESNGVLSDGGVQVSNQCNGHHKPATASETHTENVESSPKV